VVYGMGALLSRTRAKIPLNWNFVLMWGGIRGALSMVLALSLPAGLPHRELLINLVFGVVLLTILVQGLSISPLARMLKVLGKSGADQNTEIQRLRIFLAKSDLLELKKLGEEGLRDQRALNVLKVALEEEQKEATEQLRQLDKPDNNIMQGDFVRLYRRILLARKEKINQAQREGLLNEISAEQLLVDIDAQLLEIASQPETVFARMSVVKEESSVA